MPLLLSLPRDDLWITTACVAYWQYPDIDDITRRLADHFGSNFFLEVQAHNTDKQVMLNQHILELHAKTGIPLVMAVTATTSWRRTPRSGRTSSCRRE